MAIDRLKGKLSVTAANQPQKGAGPAPASVAGTQGGTLYKRVAIVRRGDGTLRTEDLTGGGSFGLNALPEAWLSAREDMARTGDWDQGGGAFDKPLHPCALQYSGSLATYDSSWQASTPYVVGERTHDASGNTFIVTVGGTSGGSEPIWDVAALGNTTPDNGVTWEYKGPEATLAGPGEVLGENRSYYDIQYAPLYIKGWLESRGEVDADILTKWTEWSKYARGPYRDTYYESNDYGTQSWFMFPRGMYEDYSQNSDGDKTTAAQLEDPLWPENNAGGYLWAKLEKGSFYFTPDLNVRHSRPMAYALNCHTYAERAGTPRQTYDASKYTAKGHTAPHNNEFVGLLIRYHAHHLYDWIHDHAWKTDYDPIGFGGTAWNAFQPFMCGLTVSALIAWDKWETERGTPDNINDHWPSTLEYFSDIANPYSSWKHAVAALIEKINTMNHSSELVPMTTLDGNNRLQSKLASNTVWIQDTDYPINYRIAGTSGGWFQATNAGTSGATEPTWDTAAEFNTTVDNNITWQYVPNDAAVAAPTSIAPNALFVAMWAVAGDYYLSIGNETKAAEMYDWGDKHFAAHCYHEVDASIWSPKEWFQQWYNSGDYLTLRAAHE